MIPVARILELHCDLTEQWHQQDITNTNDGVWGLICQQHAFNFLLWHQEDIARSPDASDTEIANVKRNIDRYNQQRNDWIEKIDDAIAELLGEQSTSPTTPLNTETPGSVIDRLSILSLRIYHLREQKERDDVDAEHLGRVEGKLSVCGEQLEDLSNALDHLLSDLQSGRKRHKTYRQFKMYNDATLNPYIYASGKLRRAG